MTNTTKKFLHLLSLILIAIVATTNLHAQPKLGIYGTVGTEKTEIGNEGWSLAETFGLYYGLAHLGPIAVAADARGDLSGNINSGLFGPRIALSLPAFPVKPYFEILGGFSFYNTASGGARNTTSGNSSLSWLKRAKIQSITPSAAGIANPYTSRSFAAAMAWPSSSSSTGCSRPVSASRLATPSRQRENLDLWSFELSDAEMDGITGLAKADGRWFGGDPNQHEES